MPTAAGGPLVRRLARSLGGFLVLVATVAGCGQHTPPSARQSEEIQAYYRDIFRDATAITIHSPHDTGFSKTVLRSSHPDVFSRIEAAIADGEVKPQPCQCVIYWQLKVSRDDGSEPKEVGVCHYLSSEDQPLADQFWLYPVRERGARPSYGIIEEIDALAGQTHTGDPLPGSGESRY